MDGHVNGALIDLRDVVKTYKTGAGSLRNFRATPAIAGEPVARVARDAGERARSVVVRVANSPSRRSATFARVQRIGFSPPVALSWRGPRRERGRGRPYATARYRLRQRTRLPSDQGLHRHSKRPNANPVQRVGLCL